MLLWLFFWSSNQKLNFLYFPFRRLIVISYCKFDEKKLHNITEETRFSSHCSNILQKPPTLPQFGQACVLVTGTIPTIMAMCIDLIFGKLVLVANMHESCLNIAKRFYTFQSIEINVRIPHVMFFVHAQTNIKLILIIELYEIIEVRIATRYNFMCGLNTINLMANNCYKETHLKINIRR